MRAHVAFTPEEHVAGSVAVAIDVLRATSTICQALAAGYEEVRCVLEVDEARALRTDGVALAGERECVAIPGFDFGNSPAEVAARDPRFTRLVLTTTNGTRLLAAACAQHETVLVGSLLNLDAVVAALRASGAGEIALLCAGSDGELALDDVYCAGRIVQELAAEPGDSARAAASVAKRLDAVAASLSAEKLRDAGLATDIELCSRESVLDVVPLARLDGTVVRVTA